MKTKTKSFDCVEMKNELQARLEAKYAGLSDAERYERMRQVLMTSDDEVSRWWRKVRKAKEAAGNSSR